MSQPDPLDFGKNINQDEASQLAMRGALDTIHKLQEISEGLKAQLRDTSNQNKALQDQLQELRTQQAGLRKAQDTPPGEAQEVRAELARLENRLKETYRDKEIRLMQQWMDKEHQLTDEFRQQLHQAQQKLDEERAKHQAEITEIEQRWERYAREKQALWESRAKDSLADIERYDTELLKNLLAKEMARLESRLTHNTQQIESLEKSLNDKQQELAQKDREKSVLEKQLQELTSLLKRSRLDYVRLKQELQTQDLRGAEQDRDIEELRKTLRADDLRHSARRDKLRRVIGLLKRSRDEHADLIPRAEVLSRLGSLEDIVAQHAQQRLYELKQHIRDILHGDLSL